MMKTVRLGIALLLLTGCTYKADDPKKDEYLDKEIAERFRTLNEGRAVSDPINAITDSISKTINVLLLLTADIENTDACINKSNAYFEAAGKKFQIDNSDFIKLNKATPLEETIRNIKRNELSLLNKIILREKKNGAEMYTAQ
ncbi:MAG: hypothetical protein ACXVPQ_08525 [Bacteroidia bacterium]